MANRLRSGERIVLSLWMGGHCFLGFVVVPYLFQHFDKAQAGAIAGQLFTAEGIFGLICLFTLLLLRSLRQRFKMAGDWSALLIVVAIIITVFYQFHVIADMNAMRAAGETELDAFASLHKLASTLYLALALIAIGLVAFDE